MKRLLKAIVPNSIKQKLTAFAWNRLNLTAQLRSGLTVKITRLGDWWIYNDIWVRGEYDEAINLTLDSPSPQLFILDLGANVGMFALRFFDLMKQRGIDYNRAFILMVEGSPTLAKELQTRLSSQPIPPTCYKVVNGLVGKKTGTARLNESGEPAQNFLSSAGTSVPFVDLTEIVKEPIALLKCDIEGSEEMFLNNYPELVASASAAIFELHHSQCDTGRCKSLLSSSFKHHRLIESHGSESVELFWR